MMFLFFFGFHVSVTSFVTRLFLATFLQYRSPSQFLLSRHGLNDETLIHCSSCRWWRRFRFFVKLVMLLMYTTQGMLRCWTPLGYGGLPQYQKTKTTNQKEEWNLVLPVSENRFFRVRLDRWPGIQCGKITKSSMWPLPWAKPLHLVVPAWFVAEVIERKVLLSVFSVSSCSWNNRFVRSRRGAGFATIPIHGSPIRFFERGWRFQCGWYSWWNLDGELKLSILVIGVISRYPNR